MKSPEQASELTELRKYMKATPEGQVNSVAYLDVTQLLSKTWSSLKITTDDANLEAYKLLGRTENLAWNPPLLTFDIERHGATVNGSTRAHVYSWTVDVEHGTAAMSRPSIRQVGVKDRPIKVQPIAEEVAGLILAGKADPRLKWKGADSVRVLISEVVGGNNQQTVSARRKRFRAALEALILSRGWRRKSVNNYERATA